jgi:hypothetical protein
MKVTIIHLDLGIGGKYLRLKILRMEVAYLTVSTGAEQLIVNVATSLKELGHDVLILTSHHDQNHCFEETKASGT